MMIRCAMSSRESEPSSATLASAHPRSAAASRRQRTDDGRERDVADDHDIEIAAGALVAAPNREGVDRHRRPVLL